MKKMAVMLGLLAALLVGTTFAEEGAVPAGIPTLQHVWVVMMENHGYGQIITNPNAPYINSLATTYNTATNFFAVGHPSLTNYLETVGGSNFGVQSDNDPDWHNTNCVPNLSSGVANTDNPPSPAICPIGGIGTDAATPAVDTTNETQGLPGENNVDGIIGFAALSNVSGMTIADQLAATGRTYRSYQQSIPNTGIDNITYTDGFFTNLTDFTMINPQLVPPLTSSDIVKLYASKHNPFVYFANVQAGTTPNNTLANTVDFDGSTGLFADLRSGHVPAYSFIAPNQCLDMHGRGNSTAFCNYDPNDNGTQAGLNPALIQQGDFTVQRIVTAIQASPAWKVGNNAIVLVFDENDYSLAPNINQVLTTVITNYGVRGVQSSQFYTHFSLLKSIESGLKLPCLNHACDPGTALMTDLFAAK